MIKVKRFKGSVFGINADLIQKVKSGPDTTVITLTNGEKYVVEETLDEIIEKVIEYKRLCNLLPVEMRKEEDK